MRQGPQTRVIERNTAMTPTPPDQEALISRIADAVVTRIEEQRRIDWIVTAVLRALDERRAQPPAGDQSAQQQQPVGG